MRKNELQLNKHNCLQATPSKVGNNKSLAQSNEGSGDENVGMTQWSSLKTHNERKTHKKNLPWIPNSRKSACPPNVRYILSKVRGY